MDILSVEDRYRRDHVFRAIVDQLSHALATQGFTPTEMREAAMLAQLHFEDRRLRRITLDDINDLRGPDGITPRT